MTESSYVSIADKRLRDPDGTGQGLVHADSDLDLKAVAASRAAAVDSAAGGRLASRSFPVEQPPTKYASFMLILEGSLVKLGGLFPSWKQRWFRLMAQPASFEYYETRLAQKPIRHVLLPIGHCKVVELRDSEGALSFRVETPDRTWHFIAGADHAKWVAAFRRVISRPPQPGTLVTSESGTIFDSPASPGPARSAGGGGTGSAGAAAGHQRNSSWGAAGVAGGRSGAREPSSRAAQAGGAGAAGSGSSGGATSPESTVVRSAALDSSVGSRAELGGLGPRTMTQSLALADGKHLQQQASSGSQSPRGGASSAAAASSSSARGQQQSQQSPQHYTQQRNTISGPPSSGGGMARSATAHPASSGFGGAGAGAGSTRGSSGSVTSQLHVHSKPPPTGEHKQHAQTAPAGSPASGRSQSPLRQQSPHRSGHSPQRGRTGSGSALESDFVSAGAATPASIPSFDDATFKPGRGLHRSLSQVASMAPGSQQQGQQQHQQQRGEHKQHSGETKVSQPTHFPPPHLRQAPIRALGSAKPAEGSLFNLTYHELHQGFMVKRGGIVPSMKRRWFRLTLNPTQFQYFENKPESSGSHVKPLGTVPIPPGTIISPSFGGETPHMFNVKTPTRDWVFVADSEAELAAWLDGFQRATLSAKPRTPLGDLTYPQAYAVMDLQRALSTHLQDHAREYFADGELSFVDKEYVDKALARLTAMETKLQQMSQVYGSVQSFQRIIEEHQLFVADTHKIVDALYLRAGAHAFIREFLTSSESALNDLAVGKTASADAAWARAKSCAQQVFTNFRLPIDQDVEYHRTIVGEVFAFRTEYNARVAEWDRLSAAAASAGVGVGAGSAGAASPGRTVSSAEAAGSRHRTSSAAAAAAAAAASGGAGAGAGVAVLTRASSLGSGMLLSAGAASKMSESAGAAAAGSMV